jgi:NAD(P)-dependent dehydrogenase (short-subunit alcohol dehydrogenase family)
MGRWSGKVVAVSGADNSVGRAVMDLARAEGATAVSLPIADEAVLGAALGAITRAHGRVDLVVNAARACTKASIAAQSADQFMATFDAIGEAAWLVQKHAILNMRETGGGVVIHVLSVLARVAAPDCAGVCAADRGVLMSAKSAALECAKAKDKIVVSAVLAGRIDGDPDHWPDGTLLPHAPVVTPEDVAEGVVFLAGDGAAYMTGVELPVDGGFLAS